MADRYWVGGTASWDGTAGTKWATTSGGAGGASVPTSADDVFFDASSTGTVTIATGNTGAKSINCTGFTGTITGTANITVAGSITLVAGMTYTHTGLITVAGSGTITTAGKNFSRLAINGTGITVGLGDNLTFGTGYTSQVFFLTAGTFNTNNYNITVNSTNSATIVISGTSTRSINLGSSTISSAVVGGGGGGIWDASTTTNLTFNAGTSTIIGTDRTAVFNGGGLTYYNLTFAAPSSYTTTNRAINGANTFNNLTIAGPAYDGLAPMFVLSANQTVNGTFSVTASSIIRRSTIASDTFGTSRTLSCANTSLTSADFRDITISGAAAPASGTNLGDCGGNSGITFSSKTIYWNLSGNQNWSATAWATSSGGTPDINNFPLAQDTAIFDNAGAAGTVTIQNFNIGNVNMSSRTNAMTFSFGNSATTYGSWTLGSGVTYSGTSTLTFSNRSTATITSSGKTFSCSITIDAPLSTVQLGDALVLDSARTLTLTRGTFNASNNNITTGLFASSNSNTRTLTMGSGIWTLSGTGSVWDLTTVTNLTFNKDTANIVLSNTTTSARTFAGGGRTYNKLTIGGTTGTSTLTISGSNTFSEIDSTKTVAHTITFTAGTTTTVTTWSVKGTAGNVVTFQSSAAGTTYTLAKAGGGYLTGIDYLNVRDAIGSPISDTWYIGANSVINTTTPNQGYALFTTQRTDNAIIVLTSTSSTSWTVPADWNNSSNSINLIGGGGGGASGYASGNNRAGGGGGGGGGFTRLTNQTLSGSITYQCGAAGAGAGSFGANGTAGGTTSWNSGAATAGGGGGGSATTTPTSTGGTGGVGTTYNGGNGGVGGFGTAANTAYTGGAGGGAGGPNGIGGNGGNGNSSLSDLAGGGGGGGNGGGANGGNGTGGTGTAGVGGNNSNGVGGGSAGVSGAVGGGGGAPVGGGTAGSGGSGIEFFGIGGGGGAGSARGGIADGGFFGGGGQGAGVFTNGGPSAANNSIPAQGAIIIVYTPSGGGISSSLSESSSVADSIVASIIYGGTIVESVIGTDTVTASIQALSDVSETSTASDAVATLAPISSSVSESSSASDANSSQPTYNGLLAETLTASDQTSILDIFNSNINESATNTDSISGGFGSSRSISESANIYDYQTQVALLNALAVLPFSAAPFAGSLSSETTTVFAQVGFSTQVSDSATASDSTDGAPVYSAAVDETASAIVYEVSSIAALLAEIDEAVSAGDVPSAQAAYLAFVQELLTATDSPTNRLLWEIINDSQSLNWQNINNSQTTTWQTINNTSGTNWSTIDDSLH